MRILAALSLALLACASGAPPRFEVVNVERPTDDGSAPPPADFQACFAGEAHGYDTNGDGKVDRVTVGTGGKDRCYGEDTNHDGKIDTWDVMDDGGKVARRAHDSNGDGRVDQVWTFDPSRHGCATVSADRNADGKPDPGSPVDICLGLSGTNPAPGPPPAGGAGGPR
ncbi:MAG TPA: hypothetical protein VIF09_16690 [Polyangiaceae bacterium]